MFLFIPFLTLTDMPEVTHSPMPSISDEEGVHSDEEGVHIHSAAEGSSFKPSRLQVLGDVPRKRQSTPVKSAQSSKAGKSATKTSLSSATNLKIKTEDEVHAQDEGSTSLPAKPPPSQRKTPSCTVSKAPDDDDSSKEGGRQNLALKSAMRGHSMRGSFRSLMTRLAQHRLRPHLLL